MKYSIKLLGRLSLLLLVVIFCEGLITFGQAFDFKGYSIMGIVFQSLIFFLCTWSALEWQEVSEK